MTSKSIPGFYDVAPLVPALQADIPVITPNQRLARQIRLAWGYWLKQQGIHSWPTPQVYTLEQWWRKNLEQTDLENGRCTVIASEQQELELWESCIRAHPDSEGLLRTRGAAMQARDAYHKLLLWNVDWRKTPHREQFSASHDSAVFLQWLTTFERALGNSGLNVLPALILELGPYTPREQLLLVEFDELPPRSRQALEAQASEVLQHRQAGAPAHAELAACQDSEQEMYAAARWAKSVLHGSCVAEAPVARPRVAIVVPDLAASRRRIDRVLREVFEIDPDDSAGLPVNFSAGIPLAQTPPVRTALCLLSLLSGKIEVKTLVELLHSPYRPDIDHKSEQELIRRLYRRGRLEISTRRLLQLCHGITDAETSAQGSSQQMLLARQLRLLIRDRTLQAKHLPGQWADLLDRCLGAFQWPGPKPQSSEEYQQIDHWHQLLGKLSELDALCPPLELRELLPRLQQLANSTVFQAQGGEHPIQVLGLLEAAGLQFDSIWLCGMAAGEWPAAPTPNPFLPVQLQRELGMPQADAERERIWAQRLLQRFRHSCSNLVASFVTSVDSIPRQASAMVEDFNRRDEAAHSCVSVPSAWQSVRLQYEQESLTDDRAPALGTAEQEGLSGGTALLESQSHCPFQAFARYRLQAQKLGDLGVSLSAAERGTLVHDALCRLWGGLETHERLLALQPAGLSAVIVESVTAALAEFKRRNPDTAGEAYLALEELRLCNLLQQWMMIERERSPFEVVAREASLSAPINGLNLQGRIDRIDRLPEGGLIVLDYKSSTQDPRDWFGDRPQKPQLPFYANNLATEVVGLGFAVVSDRACTIQGIGKQDWGEGTSTNLVGISGNTALQAWPDLLVYWQQTLAVLATDFCSGDARVEPLKAPASCRQCGLQALCRVGQQDAAQHE